MSERFDRGRWADGTPETVQPGLHRIPLPLPNDGLRAVNVYVLEEPDGLVMIDGGWAIPESQKALEDALAGLGHDLGEIRHILVTHVHRDHYTQAVALRRLVGAKVYLGAGERRGLELINDPDTTELNRAFGTLRQNGGAELVERLERVVPENPDFSDWAFPDRFLAAEELRFEGRTLRVIPTPGHTRGHVVYLDEARGLLFAGDHVLPHITPSIGFETGETELPLAHYMNSLRLMTSMADARLLPAHGPVAPSVHARAEELLAHHDDRLAHTLAALGTADLDAYAVARKLLWTRRGTPFAELTVFNQVLAVNETAAHLDVLVARGAADVEDVDGVNRYTRRAQ